MQQAIRDGCASTAVVPAAPARAVGSPSLFSAMTLESHDPMTLASHDPRLKRMTAARPADEVHVMTAAPVSNDLPLAPKGGARRWGAVAAALALVATIAIGLKAWSSAASDPPSASQAEMTAAPALPPPEATAPLAGDGAATSVPPVEPAPPASADPAAESSAVASAPSAPRLGATRASQPPARLPPPRASAPPPPPPVFRGRF
jgi:hypothetical protein